MEIPTARQIARQIECSRLPILSSRNRGWENILVEHYQHPPGEGKTQYINEHALCLSLAPRPVQFLQIKGGKTHRSLYGKGDLSITPAAMPFFARWDDNDSYVQIRLASHFMQDVARETIHNNSDRLELVPEFRARDPQIEAIAMMMLNELKQGNAGETLYVESLTNVLAVHLVRQYAVPKLHLKLYRGGLPEHHLRQVLDYINDSLDQDIKLADLAALLNLSQFHFSHLFKQSLGIAPYQYLLQQRIERAKQLLKQTDQSIMDIALMCGFNSHSHLSKQFRQFTGVTPTIYRES